MFQASPAVMMPAVVAAPPPVVIQAQAPAPAPVIIQAQAPAPAPVIIQTQTSSGGGGLKDNVIIGKAELGSSSAITTCRNCRQRVETRVVYKVGCYSWCICILLMCFGLVFGCCLIPFFAKKCKDAHHSCPQCNTQLCVHKRCSCC